MTRKRPREQDEGKNGITIIEKQKIRQKEMYEQFLQLEELISSSRNVKVRQENFTRGSNQTKIVLSITTEQRTKKFDFSKSFLEVSPKLVQ